MRFDELQKKLRTKVVGIAGCGGLGSNAAVALARVGVGTLIVADFDAIEETNLNRQYYFYDQIGHQKASALKENIRRIDPSIHVDAHVVTLAPTSVIALFSKCDLILEAFDKAEMKEMIIETVLSLMPEKLLISGVGMAGWGRNESITVDRHGNLILIGDQQSEASKEHPPLAPRVGVVSNMMANAALEILLGKEYSV
jgi:sulfur carrier protein ThiS adenylyltransferase